MTVFGISVALDDIAFLSRLHDIYQKHKGCNYNWVEDGFYKTVYDLLLSGF